MTEEGQGSQPQFSSDGKWWWTGSEWVPASQAPTPPPSPSPLPAPPTPPGPGAPAQALPPAVALSAVAPATPARSAGWRWARWWTVALGLLLCFPVGLVLTWLTSWQRPVKIVLTAATVVVYALAIVAAATAPQTTQPGGSAVAAVTPKPSPAKSTRPSASPTPTPSSKSSPSPAPTPSRATSPSATPSPAADPHALTVSNVINSIHDNQNFIFNDKFDNMKVTITGGVISLSVKPTLFDETDTFKTGAADALVLAEATLNWYPAATQVHVVVQADFTDLNGQTTTEDATVIDLTKTTAAKLNYAGLRDRMESGEWWIMYFDANGYYVHPAVWKHVSSSDQGLLAGNCLSESPYC